ncbi:INAR1 protein, partial [Alectura lathami]|nr:INAR1 protein [Alectura lathami]
GQTTLKSPQDIEVYVINTNLTLRWNYTGDGTNVTFSAEYRWFDDFLARGTEWKELPGCQNVSSTECSCLSAITECCDVHHVRVRAERQGERSPWSSVVEMIPYDIAQIGPPGIALQSINGDIKIKVSPPEANQLRKIWINDLFFKYNLVIWENSSDAKNTSQILPIFVISGLEPETTYCMKVQATLPSEYKEGLFSPTRCIKTTRKVNDLLCPTNVRASALNMEFHLHWDTQYEHPVKYTVQYLSGYRKQLPEDYSDKWLSVSRCENITDTECDFSSVITAGLYYLRVQAMSESNKSCLSDEVEVNPLVTNDIGPPAVKLDISGVMLHIQISPPQGPGNVLMSNYYDLSYQILYWKNSSDHEEEVQMTETKQTIVTIYDLTPSTLYCVKVQAFSKGSNKSSAFSNVECIKTLGDTIFPLIILATFVAALIAVLVVATLLTFFLYQAYNKIKYVFFPSCQPPLNIEGFGRPLFHSPFLPTAEEPVVSCYVVESTIAEEVNQIDFRDYNHSKQSSQDSGNYSYSGNTSGSKGSEETLGEDI